MDHVLLRSASARLFHAPEYQVRDWIQRHGPTYGILITGQVFVEPSSGTFLMELSDNKQPFRLSLCQPDEAQLTNPALVATHAAAVFYKQFGVRDSQVCEPRSNVYSFRAKCGLTMILDYTF